jgi:hypothetical protein
MVEIGEDIERLGVPAELHLTPSDVVEGEGLPAGVTGGPSQVEGLLGVVDSEVQSALSLPQLAEVVVADSLPDQVAGPSVQVEGNLVLGMGLAIVAEQCLGTGQQAVGGGLRGDPAQGRSALRVTVGCPRGPSGDTRAAV